MNELALFAGAGGSILASELRGRTVVCAVERNAYAAQVLAQRQNDGILRPSPVWSDVCSFDGRPWRGIVDTISGGFPCQDISPAGTRAGIFGSRSGLWKQMVRIIDEVQPEEVDLENLSFLVGRGLAVVLGDLAELGYDAHWCVVGARHLGAPHARDRTWLVGRKLPHSLRCHDEGLFEESPHSQGRTFPVEKPPRLLGGARWGAWPPEPYFRRVGHGLAFRVDRLTALGNGQVPRVAAAAFAALSRTD
ncbi:DNA cytosine methyltransferase [Escherichia coli]